MRAAEGGASADPSCPGNAALHTLTAAFPKVAANALENLPPFVGARHAFELDWLRGLSGITPGTAQLLAVRTACLAAAWGPTALRNGAAGTNAEGEADILLGASRGPADPDYVARSWAFAQPVEQLLAAGGDERLALSPETSLNRYGCSPWPRPQVISFGSCTASSLSPQAFAAAERRRRAILQQALHLGPDHALQVATQDTENAILTYFDVSDLATAILTASGTDAALTVTGLLAAEYPNAAITSVLVSPSETGSGVPLAVQGRHFAGMSPEGSTVEKGARLAGLHRPPDLSTIALRHADGQPRAADDVAQDCEAAVLSATLRGRAVLHAIDGSKTGLAAPDRPTLLRLAKRFGSRLDVVIDACQARIEPALVRWYLSHGFPVLVTGSKFFAAPGFCGAVLFPQARLSRIRHSGFLPSGLAAYTRLQGGFGSRLCLGLLLRWEAALHDMAAFASIPADEIGRKLFELGQSARHALAADRRLHLVPAPRPPGMGWSDRRSVFTFKVAADDGWLDSARLRRLYLALQDPADAESGPLCQIGQPVEIGSSALGGLRIAFSAQQVLNARDTATLLPAVVSKLRSVLDAAAHQSVKSQSLVSS